MVYGLRKEIRESFTHGEGVSTPGECAKNKVTFNYLSSLENMTYICYISCLFRKRKKTFIFFRKKKILFFSFFWGRQGICPHSYVSPDTMRKSDLRSSF